MGLSPFRLCLDQLCQHSMEWWNGGAIDYRKWNGLTDLERVYKSLSKIKAEKFTNIVMPSGMFLKITWKFISKSLISSGLPLLAICLPAVIKGKIFFYTQFKNFTKMNYLRHYLQHTLLHYKDDTPGSIIP